MNPTTAAALVSFVIDVNKNINEVDQSTVTGRQFVKMFQWNVKNGQMFDAADLAIRYFRESR